MNEIQKAKELTRRLAGTVATEQATTLAMHGLDPEVFKGVLFEAMLSTPAIGRANQADLGRALRLCCQDGVIPNGREAALIVNKQGGVQFRVMRDGLCKILHRVLKADIQSGYVREGQQVQIQQILQVQMITQMQMLKAKLMMAMWLTLNLKRLKIRINNPV